MANPYLSVVIPCYDEMANLQKGVMDKVLHYLEKKKCSYEVIVVDDGSKDGSVDFLGEFIKENKGIRLIKLSHSGKAGAVTEGMLAARGDVILFTDMDQATPIEELDKLLPFIEQGYDVVIGSRRDQRKGAPWTRLVMSRVWMFIRNLVIGLGIEDTQCGFKLFNKKSAQAIFPIIKNIHNGFKKIKGSSVSAGFDVELLYIAKKKGFRIKEVLINWLHVETRRVNLVKDAVESLISLLRIRQNQLQGKYS